MSVPEPAELDVQRTLEGVYVYYLRQPGEKPAATRPDSRALVNQSDVATMCSGINVAIQRANRGPDDGTAVEKLRGYGRGLCNELLPRGDHGLNALRAALLDAPGPLLICADAGLHVHWELLYSDTTQEFLGLSRDVARRLKTRYAAVTPSVGADDLRCLLIADPGGSDPGRALPDAAGEVSQLRAWFEQQHVDCDVLEGDDATYDRTVEHLLGEPYDVIHYAGHIERHPETMSFAWCLKDRMLPAEWIRNQLNGSPVVFLNGCSSAAAGNILEGVEAMTDAMLEGGARAVIGSIYPVPDVGARKFAECFYGQLLSGAPYGAAMRHARTELSKDPTCRASWAGFVLYGDPCLRFVEPVVSPADRLATSLEAAGIGPDEIDAGATAVLRQACAHAALDGVLGTADLLRGLVAGADTSLRDGLTDQGIPPEALDSVLGSTFATATQAMTLGDDVNVELSSNARTIIAAAAAAARAGTRALSEGDLQRAWVACENGATQRLLARLGVDLPGLLRRPAAPVDLGERTAVEIARAIAVNSGRRVVGSPQLLAALLAVSPSPVVEALRRVGLRPDALDGARPPASWLAMAAGDDGNVKYTANATRVLGLARSYGADPDNPTIRDDELFRAFVAQGGGRTGASLQRKGLPLAVLTSPLFADRGELRTACFDETARAALEDAVDCARRKRQDRLTEEHLLYGLLGVDGSLADAIRGQERDPAQLGDLLFVTLQSSSAVDVDVSALRIAQMSGTLLAALCAADHHRDEDERDDVGEPDLTTGLLRPGGGRAGVFLVEQGIRLRDLPT
jgi:hypothetical protein